MDKLKECPFCGGEASVWNKSRYDICVRCDYCDAQVEWQTTKDKAIAAWNCRDQPENKPKECHAMERVEGGISYCSDKQSACDGCRSENKPLTLDSICEALDEYRLSKTVSHFTYARDCENFRDGVEAAIALIREMAKPERSDG